MGGFFLLKQNKRGCATWLDLPCVLRVMLGFASTAPTYGSPGYACCCSGAAGVGYGLRRAPGFEEFAAVGGSIELNFKGSNE